MFARQTPNGRFRFFGLEWLSVSRSSSSFRFAIPFTLHRLSKAIAFTIHLEDLAMVSQSVQQCGRHAFALEDLAPVAEREVAGDQQALAFVAVGEDLE